MADDKSPPPNQIVLPFADGDYTFALPVGQIAELQAKCDAGIGMIFARLLSGRYKDHTGATVTNLFEARFRHEDIRETIRLGLIGGNSGLVGGQQIEVPPPLALNLVRNYVDARPLQDSWDIAAGILSAFIIGYTDKAAQKKMPRKAATPNKAG